MRLYVSYSKSKSEKQESVSTERWSIDYLRNEIMMNRKEQISLVYCDPLLTIEGRLLGVGFFVEIRILTIRELKG